MDTLMEWGPTHWYSDAGGELLIGDALLCLLRAQKSPVVARVIPATPVLDLRVVVERGGAEARSDLFLYDEWLATHVAPDDMGYVQRRLAQLGLEYNPDRRAWVAQRYGSLRDFARLVTSVTEEVVLALGNVKVLFLAPRLLGGTPYTVPTHTDMLLDQSRRLTSSDL